MFFGQQDHLDTIGKFILKLTYPHEHNNHRPLAIKSHGILVFMIIILLLQVVTNVSTKSSSVLGFATNISVSEIINLTNEQRDDNGLGTVTNNTSLNKAAGLKAKDMFEDDYWDHYAPDGTAPWYFFSLVGYKYTWAGENLARDFATSSGVVDAWMASSGHRANILNKNFTEIGVAVVNGNLEGEDTTLVVQLFGRPTIVAATAPTNENNQVSGSTETGGGSKVEADLTVPASKVEQTKESIKKETQKETTLSPLSGSGSSLADIPPVSLVKNATASQKVTISLLFMMFVLLVFDSVVVFRKKHIRLGSHSLAHASMIFLLIIVSLLYGYGSII